MLNALFVVWRESFEAVMVVGILFSFLNKEKDPSARSTGLKSMWLGVSGGVLLSVALALGINLAETELQGIALEYFQLGMLIVACILMTHMCLWMKIHGRHMKSDLEGGLSQAMTNSKRFEIAMLSMLAVAREGSETVIFLYGMTFEAAEKHMMSSLVIYSAIGFFLALATWVIFNRGLRFFSQRVFFNVTTAFLLLTASSLIVNVTRKLIQGDYLPTIRDVAWDTSFLLDERTPFGQFLSAFTGYQSTPALMTVIVFIVYWSMTYMIYKILMKRDIKAHLSVRTV
jgi:high-affinity iron transporter